MHEPLDADVAVLTSRFSLDRDGGYAVAILSRLVALQRAGVSRPLLLSLDAGSPQTHVRAGADAAGRGLDEGTVVMRNLFDEAILDQAWLFARAGEGGRTPGIAYREVRDADGRRILSLPVIDNPSRWHLSDAHIVVHHVDGDRVIPGFGALYVAWLSSVAEELRTAAGDEERRLVVICESRQVGEVLAQWSDPRVRIVHTVHNSHLARPDDSASPVRDEGWRRWLDALDRFDLVLWPTRAQSREVSARFPHRVRFASVPSAILHPAPRRPAPGRSRDVAIMACRLVEQKRVDLAIEIWAEVVRRRPSARLDIYGHGPLRDRLAELIRARGLGDSVRLCGYSDDVGSAMQKARIFLSTSAFEGQGLAIVEALAAGLPVVSFDVRYGPAEMIGDGGILVPAGDVPAAAAAIVSMLEDDDRWARASEGARSAAARFLPGVVGARLREEIDEVLTHPASRLRSVAQT